MIREFIHLFKNRRDNPLITYGFPPRRSWIFRAAFVFVVVLTAVLSIYGLWAYMLKGTTAGTSNSDLLLFLTIALAGVGIPASLLYFSFDFRRGDRLQDLYLSRITPNEVVFGFLYWGVFTALVIMLICIGAHVAALLMSENLPPFWMAPSPISLYWHRLILFLLLSTAALLKAIQALMRGLMSRLLSIFTVAATIGFLFLMTMILPLVLVDYLLDPEASPVTYVVFLGFITIVLAIVGIHAATARAGALYFHTLEPSLMIVADALVRERAAKPYRREHAPSARRKLLGQMKRHWIEYFLYSLLGTSITFYLASIALLSSTAAAELRIIDIFMIQLACGLFGVAAVGYRSSISQQPIPIISGMITWSSSVSYIPVAVAQTIAFLLQFVLFREVMPPLVFMMIPLMIYLRFCYWFWQMMIPRRGRKALLAIAGASMVGLLLYCSLFKYSGYDRPYYTIQLTPMNALTIALYTIATAMVCAMPLGFRALLRQRIHESEVLHHPAFMLSTEPVPDGVTEILAPPQMTVPSQERVETPVLSA